MCLTNFNKKHQPGTWAALVFHLESLSITARHSVRIMSRLASRAAARWSCCADLFISNTQSVNWALGFPIRGESRVWPWKLEHRNEWLYVNWVMQNVWTCQSVKRCVNHLTVMQQRYVCLSSVVEGWTLICPSFTARIAATLFWPATKGHVHRTMFRYLQCGFFMWRLLPQSKPLIWIVFNDLQM